MATTAPYLWLGPGGFSWLEFGPDNRHATFVTIATRVARELGGTVVETLPNPADDGKEYADIVVGQARLLLMRKAGLGIALGAAYRELSLMQRIAAVYGAECRGWRWSLYRLWHRVIGRSK
jgi:hypothetical protein